MTARQLLRAFALLSFVSLTATAATSRFTTKELAQGYRDGVILAKPLASNRATISLGEAKRGNRVRQSFARLGDLRVLELAVGENPAQAAKRLRQTGEYEFAEPDYIMHESAIPNDPAFPSQWALQNTGQASTYTAGADTKATIAWDTIHDAPNVVVAIIDNGVRIDHQDIAPNLWANPNPTIGDIHGARFIDGVESGDITDDTGHGTHVAGIICAAGNNGVASAGVVWKTRLMVLKNATADGYSATSDSAACIDYAVAHGASVINCSFGGRGYSHAMFTAIQSARTAGVIVVCAAGNEGADTDIEPDYPSCYLLDNVVAVGNSDGADRPAADSNWGNLVDLFAPGTSIPSLDFSTTDGVVTKSGTSMSAPFVTGALVLVRALHPTDTYRDAINRLLNGVAPNQHLYAVTATHGRLDIRSALDASSTPFNSTAATASIITGTELSIRANNRWSWTAEPTTTPSGEPVHAAGTALAPLWWEWYAPATGSYVIDTSGSDHDTAIDVYTGTPSSGLPDSAVLSPVVGAANDDYGSEKTSRVMLKAQSGTFYFICVSSPRSSFGYTQLNIASVPSNDNFAGAKILTGASAQDNFDNQIASVEPNEPAILGKAGAASVWYQWTAPKNGHFEASTFSFDFDALQAVYTGTALDNLKLVTANDDTDPGASLQNEDSRCEFDATAGVTYYLQVESKGDARGNAFTTITDAAWQFSNAGGYFDVAPAVTPDGIAYCPGGTPDTYFYAIASDGTLKWTYGIPSPNDYGSPLIGPDSTVYQGLSDGSVVALKADGTVRWKHALGTSTSADASLALGIQTIYAHGDDGYLCALDSATGDEKWKFNAAAQTSASPSIAADGTVYLLSNGRECLYAVNPNGTLQWQYDLHAYGFGAPAIDAVGNIYVATDSNSTVTSLTSAGALRWAYQTSTSSLSVGGSVTLSGDGKTVYVGVQNTGLVAIDAAKGQLRWTYACGSGIYGSTPAVDADGVIYVGGQDGLLYAVNADGTLKRTWATALPIVSSPAIVGKRLYVGSTDDKLYAFDIDAPAAAGPWPQYAHDAQRTGSGLNRVFQIVSAPTAQTVKQGSALTLSVVASAATRYQWVKDGKAIPGATSATYTVASATAVDAGSYVVQVSGSTAELDSEPALVTVAPPPAVGTRLINISIRSQAGTGSETLIVGAAIVGGSAGATKPLLIRGVGPTLTTYGVPNVLSDPLLTIYRNKVVVATNDGWRGDPEISAIGDQVGAFALQSNASADTALYAQFETGSYSCEITGKSGTGVALAELYDATPDDRFNGNSPRIANASARTHIGTGGDVLIVGFTISGTGTERLLIRGVGPKLAAYGVGGVLNDPKLELYSGLTKIDENDNWSGSAEIITAADSVQAFSLDAGSKDAVLIETLQPGGYTAVVRGVDDTTGVGLVELYELAH